MRYWCISSQRNGQIQQWKGTMWQGNVQESTCSHKVPIPPQQNSFTAPLAARPTLWSPEVQVIKSCPSGVQWATSPPRLSRKVQTHCCAHRTLCQRPENTRSSPWWLCNAPAARWKADRTWEMWSLLDAITPCLQMNATGGDLKCQERTSLKVYHISGRTPTSSPHH